MTAQAPQEPADFRRAAPMQVRVRRLRRAEAIPRGPARASASLQAGEGVGRRHLQPEIDSHKIDLTHVTERVGSPQTLVCTKTTASYQASLKKYHEDQEHLKTIEAIRGEPAEMSRMQQTHRPTMIILHASASDGELVLWGETSAPEPAKAPPKAARRKASAQPARSPIRPGGGPARRCRGRRGPRLRDLQGSAAVAGRLAPLERRGGLAVEPAADRAARATGRGPDRSLGGPGPRLDDRAGRRDPGRLQGPADPGPGGGRRQDADLLGDGPAVRRGPGRRGSSTSRAWSRKPTARRSGPDGSRC